MPAPSFPQLLEETLALSAHNYLTDNVDFFARLLLENLGPTDSREALARHYLSQQMHLQTARLLQKPASEAERYLLGVSLFRLDRFDDAIAALTCDAKSRQLTDFLRECEQKAVETVFLDPISHHSDSDALTFGNGDRSPLTLSPEIKRKPTAEGLSRMGYPVSLTSNAKVDRPTNPPRKDGLKAVERRDTNRRTSE